MNGFEQQVTDRFEELGTKVEDAIKRAYEKGMLDGAAAVLDVVLESVGEHISPRAREGISELASQIREGRL